MRRVWGIVAFLALLTGCGGDSGLRKGAVAADHEIASQVGVEILKKGGNAVDAAVATSLTLSVVRPYSCGLGGGGFMVVHLAKEEDGGHGRAAAAAGDYAINYRETAPAAVGPDYFLNQADPMASRVGATAAGVPGSVAGLMLALERYGSLERNEVLAPAIKRAKMGFLADEDYVSSCQRLIRDFREHPEYQQRFAFVWERYLLRGAVKVGDRIQNPEQAEALQLISDRGADAFYRGPIADAIVTASQADGGTINHGDLGAYRAVEVEPLTFQFDGRTIVTMPPPSSGGVAMAEALKTYAAMESRAAEVPGAARTLAILREYAGNAEQPAKGKSISESFGAVVGRAFFMQAVLVEARQSPYILHPLTEAFKHAFADRAEWLGDPAFVDVPVERLTSGDYAAERAATFDPAHTLASERYGTRSDGEDLPDDHGTSHFSVIDRWGNAVACTETINTEFGSFLAVEPYGFILNNEMDDFTTRPGKPNAFGLIQSSRNAPAPGKRPLSSMTPTIAISPTGEVEAVLGASGGPRIITSTAQLLISAFRDNELFNSAVLMVQEPRFHHQWSPDVLEMEDAVPGALIAPTSAEGTGPFSGRSLYDARGPSIEQDRPLADRMRDLGHIVKKATSHAVVQLIIRRPDGSLDAASDPRKGGRAAAY